MVLLTCAANGQEEAVCNVATVMDAVVKGALGVMEMVIVRWGRTVNTALLAMEWGPPNVITVMVME